MPPSAAPPPILPTSALGVCAGAFAAIRAAEARGFAQARAMFELSLAAPSDDHGFLVLAGIDPLLDALERFRIKSDELSWLEAEGVLDARTRKRIETARFAGDVDAAPEGTLVFPGVPVLTIEGPYWQTQLVASMVVAGIGQATLVATKFARATLAAAGTDVVEHGAASFYRLGGSPTLARAAFVGGAVATSFALAAKRYAIPLFVSAPASLALAPVERGDAIAAWIASSSGALRVDSADELPAIAEAVQRAARRPAWDELEATLEIAGGDRAEIAREAIALFAREGLRAPRLVVSGDLDERAIAELRREHAPASGFCVSPHVAADATALARYDLVAIEQDGAWSPRLALRGSVASTGEPGRKVVLRYVDGEAQPCADVAHLTNERLLRAKDGRFVERATGFVRRIAGATSSATLLSGMMRGGKRVVAAEPASVARERAMTSLARLPGRFARLARPARYPVGMTTALAGLKADMMSRGE